MPGTIASKELTKPKTDLSAASKFQNGATAAYWGYKAFQALRVCSGDVTALAEIATECLEEGLSEAAVADPGMMVEAVEAVVGAKGGIKAFRKDVKHFSQFSAALSEQLNSDGNAETHGRTMESAERLYDKLIESDRDGSGGISIEEYVAFSEQEGVPRNVAETMFFQADVHGRGQISFEEWTAMMVGRVGRAEGSFNCGGHHGLTQYVAVCNGLACDFCHAPISAGDLAKGCRRCDCDACASCSGLSSAQPPPPPPPPPPQPGVAPTASAASLWQSHRGAAAVLDVERPGAFDCRWQHGLVPFTVTVGPSVACDWCGHSVPPGQLCFSCRVCDADGCADCAAASLGAPDGNASGLTCPGRHGLAQARAAGGCVCDFCRAPVAVGAKVYSCRMCGVDACVGCVWKDHRRALSAGGEFVCERFRTHAARPLDITTTQQQLCRRCNWCLGVPCLGHCMLRCDLCDCDACALCVATVPAQEARVRRVRAAAAAAATAAAHAAWLAGTDAAGLEPAERLLRSISIGETAGAAGASATASTAAAAAANAAGGAGGSGPPPPPPPPPAGVSPPSSPRRSPLSPPRSPPPSYAPRSPPPRYRVAAAPAHADGDGRAAAENAALPPSYRGAIAGTPPAATIRFCGDHAGGAAAGAAAAPPPAQAPVAAAPSYQDVAAAASSLVAGGQLQPPHPPSYSGFSRTGRVRAAAEGNPLPPSAPPRTPESEMSAAPTAGAADGAGSLFAFDSMVRVLGVEDPEVQGKLLIVIGFEAAADGGGGTVVLRRRGRVVRVPASKVYRLID